MLATSLLTSARAHGEADDEHSSKRMGGLWPPELLRWLGRMSPCKGSLAVAVLTLLSYVACLFFLGVHPEPQRVSHPQEPVREEPPVVLVDNQRYRAVQYLGINLFTAPGTEVDGCFGDRSEMEQCYLGSLGCPVSHAFD